MSKQKNPVVKAPKPSPGNGVGKPDPQRETRERLKELDTIDVEFGDQFYDRMHDQIMARIEERVPSEQTSVSQRKQAANLNLVRLSL